MKHILIILGLISLLGLTFHKKVDKENIVVNPTTGLELIEEHGRYALKSENSKVNLGTGKKARQTLSKIVSSFASDSVEDYINLGDESYRIRTDGEGRYVELIGLGMVKVRPSDANLFLGVIEGKIIGSKMRIGIKNGKEIFESFWDGLTED